jgi:hypothetical protein
VPPSSADWSHGLLVDRRPAKAVDEVDVRLLEPADESLRERRHRHPQPPLPLGVHRIEGQRRLSPLTPVTTMGFARNLDVDVL